jgi:hypothetical protein
VTIEKYKAQLKSDIWKSLAQSGIPLTNISTENQNKLVDNLSDNLLILVNEILGETTATIKVTPNIAITDDDEEKILWEGRPFLSLVEFYTLTNERIKVVKGLIGKDIENFELIRVQDIDITQNLSERIMGIGDITITGADSTNPIIVLRNIQNPSEVYELLRKAWLAARKKYGLIFREEM